MTINLRLNRSRIVKILRISTKHGMVSLICGSIEYTLFLFFYTKLAYSLMFSYVTSYFFATVIGYLLHNYYTFNVRLMGKKSAVFFMIQSILVLALGYVTINVFLLMSFIPQMAKLFQLFVTFGFNVAFGRYLTFRKNNHRN
jgi:putative flippase GtrA